MTKILACIVLCLPLAAAAEAKGKKVKAQPQANSASVTEEKIVYGPAFSVKCSPPSISKERIVLKATHPFGFFGRAPTVNEVILAVTNEGGVRTATVIANDNYEVNAKGVRTGAKLPTVEAYVWRYCLRHLPENVRALIAGKEMDLLIWKR